MKRVLFLVLVIILASSPLFAQEVPAIQDDDLDSINLDLDSLGKDLAIGIAVSGAAIGIGTLVASALDGIARNPELESKLTNTMYTGIIACAGLALGAMAVTIAF